jgi:UDP-glucose 4-epimerase
MKNFIIVTGGAGFVGSNLIKSLLKKTNKKIISLDNYSSGNKKNHIKNDRVKYLNGDTIDISKYLKREKKEFTLFFILESLQEFIKVLKNLMNVLNQTQLAPMQYLNFV